ncbi:D-amino acid dehydrogenase [Pukyongiella litopenaei]|uniref:D-amino acid dehydrogenase n=1 Tax=Pukyongiella litopenaei TaxID=2605946 RepID=A0A2S0MRY5_9RHOB|nr:D-amino acid dehydrogenase [Pukyongiella litopenaei]AVO38658.1 D-amino acid dehydrogenase [Pukyongiella litopenaei]
MRILVIGAGVVGVTTAWYLVQDGHQVTVVDQNPGPAEGASFGNAGGVCPGFAGPWAAPGMPQKALRWMFVQGAPLRIRPRLDPAQWRWLAAFLRNCTAARFAANKERMQRSAHYSKACLVELRDQLGLAYDHASLGVLQLFADDSELAGGRRSAEVLRKLGIAHRLLGPGEIAEVEPALAVAEASFAGGLHLTDDETGDSRLFTEQLVTRLKSLGCSFRFGNCIAALEQSGGRISAARTDRGEVLQADGFVIATGSRAPELLGPLKIDVPIYPVKGYSLTAEITDEARAPRSSVMDEHSKLMITRLGRRIRVAGVAELAGHDPRLDSGALAAIARRASAIFPGAADYGTASQWCGFRPMTPDGPAIVGQRGHENLYLNIGHGSNGWTQACGTSRVLADIISGRPPAVSL